jgi:hypothetical protein
MAFQDNTRRKFIPLTSQAKGATNPLSWDIPKTGLLGGIFLNITGSVAGTLSAPNALGMSSIIRKVRLITNGGIDLVNISGPGYAYLLRYHLENYVDATPQNTGKVAVTATTFNLDMYIPTVLNSRDPIGLFMLQNEQTLVQLQVEFEADAVVATGATVTATVIPSVEVFTVPVDPKDWPALNTVQQIIEDTRVISGAGDYDYSWPRGNTYVQVLHGLGIAVSAVDTWTRAKLIVNQSEILADYTPGLASVEFNKMHGYARGLGSIPFDMIGTSGMGTFGSSRDLLYSALVTEMVSRLTASGAATLYTVRRQLVALR